MTTTVSGTATGLKPLGDRLVVKPTPREEMTKSGIVLPDTAMEVSEGQKVLFQKYAGTEFKLDDDELLILSQKDILAVIE